MLVIFACLVAVSLLITAWVGLESRSYLFALALGFLGAAAVLLIMRRFRGRTQALNERIRAFGVRKLCLILALICFALHLIWVLLIRIEPFSDYQTYWQCACALATGQAIESTEYIAVYPHILGYSSFLSIFVRIFGEYVLVGAVLNAALTTLGGLLIFSICRRAAGELAAVMGFVLWIFMPTKLMMNPLIFSEPLYTCLLLLFMLAVSELERRQEKLSKKPALWVLCGAALGLLMLWINIVRPIAVILLIAFLIWFLLLRGAALTKKRLWLMWGIVTVCMLFVFKIGGSAWDSHVEKVLGEEPASLPIYNIYVGFNEDTKGQWSADDMDVLFAYKRGENLTASEAQRRMLPHLKERLSSGIDFARLFRSKLFAFMGNDELGGYTYRFTRSERFVRVCMIIDNVYYFFVIALMLAGLYALFRRGAQSTLFIVPLFALGLTLAHMLVEVSSRYHYSLIPMFIIVAAFTAAEKSKFGGYHHDAETVHSHSVL